LHAETVDEITKCMNELKLFNGTVFLEVKVKKGFRNNLGRPTTTTIENKKILMEFIKEK
jgi:phosphonopyruvate decarboxylase